LKYLVYATHESLTAQQVVITSDFSHHRRGSDRHILSGAVPQKEPMIRSLAANLTEKKIRVNAVAPGPGLDNAYRIHL